MTVLIPDNLTDALLALGEHPESLVLAGGTDAMVEINGGHRRPETVVSVGRIPELRSWTFDAESSTLRIGAGVTYAELEGPRFREWVPALAQAARTVGSPQIRHAATLGGNVGTCSPAGDGLPVLAALDAVVHLVSSEARRSMPFGEFMLGPKRTALAPGELIEAITAPVFSAWQGYAKVGVRNAMVISSAGACLAVDDRGRVRLALGSVGPTIIRCREAEEFIASAAGSLAAITDAEADEFARLAAAAAKPIDDHRSTAAYRRHAVAVLARRLLRRASAGG
jgi:CO/xanthine dehydrogenase FAD-binding subunit